MISNRNKPQASTTPALLVLVALLLSVLLSSVARADQSQSESAIRIGGDHNYPPYEFINEAGEPDGYNTELTRAIAEVMGIKIEIELGTWDQMRRKLERRELDVLQGMVHSDERAKDFDFSPPHAIINQSIFARKGDPKANTLAALSGKSVIVQEGGIMHDYLLQQQVGAELILVDTHTSALRLLASGQHDYALVANLPGLYLGRELELSNITPVGKPFGAQQYGYSVPKGQQALLAQFSEGLAILKNTGRQQAIYDKWLGPLERPGLPWRGIGLAAGGASAVLLLVLGGIMIWNRMLTRQVMLRTEELALQQQQLIQADKMTSLGILVSGVAHEINNPSSLLLFNLPVLQEVHQDLEELLENHYQTHGDFYLGGLAYSRMRDEIPAMLDDMLKGAQRVRRIVDDLRDFARQEPADKSESVDLNDVVATAIRLVDNTIRNATDHFQVNYAESLPRLQGNAQRIEQVVINLIVNACQALNSRDQSISVSTRYQPDSGELQLEIADQGCGIDTEHLPRLSDPFFTTKPGTGWNRPRALGLSRHHQRSRWYPDVPINAWARHPGAAVTTGQATG